MDIMGSRIMDMVSWVVGSWLPWLSWSKVMGYQDNIHG